VAPCSALTHLCNSDPEHGPVWVAARTAGWEATGEHGHCLLHFIQVLLTFPCPLWLTPCPSPAPHQAVGENEGSRYAFTRSKLKYQII